MRRLSLKSALIIVAIASILFAWWADRSRLVRLLDAERKENLLTGSSWVERQQNIAEVASKPEPDVAMLLYALSDPDNHVRQTALQALRKIPPTEYPDDLVRSPDGRVLAEFERWLIEKAERD